MFFTLKIPLLISLLILLFIILVSLYSILRFHNSLIFRFALKRQHKKVQELQLVFTVLHSHAMSALTGEDYWFPSPASYCWKQEEILALALRSHVVTATPPINFRSDFIYFSSYRYQLTNEHSTSALTSNNI